VILVIVEMSTPKNQAAWLIKAGTPLEVQDAPLPVAGIGEIVVKNAAIAINPLDCHMQDLGVFVQQWPAIFGCEVAGEVYEVGPDVDRFKKGDRVIGYVQDWNSLPCQGWRRICRHAINLISGRSEDGAFALYTVIPADKAAILPDSIAYRDGVVVPFALEGAVCALSLQTPGVAMPGVSTPALGLPYPSLEDTASRLGKTLIVYGGSSSIGSMTTQLATAAGIDVISICGAHNIDFSKQCGAAEVLDRADSALVDHVVDAVSKYGQDKFVGVFDAIGSPETYGNDLAILAKLGGGHLACTHPPPTEVPSNVKAGMMWVLCWILSSTVLTEFSFAVNDVAAPVWQNWVTRALESGKLKCFPPPTVVGKGLKYIQEALKKSAAGVSATKLVVEL
jgi:NADPH:quinone reductase-like Zn-dependent oxidoreductase